MRTATGADATEEDIQRKPWKYIGYKGYANFIASDDDFLILRRFESLSARVALSLQDKITVLEEELDKFDRIYSRPESRDVHNGTMRDDIIEERTELLDIIAKKLQRYNDFLLQQTSLKKLPPAQRRDIRSIRNWHFNHDYGAIATQEQKYLDKPDLINIVHKEKTPLRRFIDSSLYLRTLPIFKQRKDELYHYDAGHVSYYSDKRIDGFVSAVIVAIGVTMLITPLWILQGLNTLTMKLGIITIFIFIFLLLLSFTMVSKPFEALGATAAYAAVLMVFIQFGTADT
ncbi:uncharacterized protein DNG_03286 [Cephalotrichum gorgonifer]|uniref:DUF6594 domain-containing protein n=1 Tax=Cephalotrichum gorgonifer TaxID=2041049 RepID=A0AAE8STI1_9PEZI|nr:uncharacterized protein DNG_03286 [Cephalotrichum gorgonifer]